MHSPFPDSSSDNCSREHPFLFYPSLVLPRLSLPRDLFDEETRKAICSVVEDRLVM